MKKVDYILLSIIAGLLIGGFIYCQYLKGNAEKVAEDNARLKQLHAQDEILKHQTDSLDKSIKSSNQLLLKEVALLKTQRDSVINLNYYRFKHFKTEYEENIRHLSAVPDDGLHGIFAKQLSAPGSH